MKDLYGFIWIDIEILVEFLVEFLDDMISPSSNLPKKILEGWGLVLNLEAAPEPRARGPRSERDVANDVVFGAARLGDFHWNQ